MRDSWVSISDSQHARTDGLLSINKLQMMSDSCVYTVIKTHEPRRLNEPKEKQMSAKSSRAHVLAKLTCARGIYR